MNNYVRRWLVLAFALLSFAGATQHEAAAAGRAALVIGNSAYAFSPLVNPANDAKLMAATLGKVGFDVTTVLDADRQSMQRAMIEFSRAIRDTDTVGLFYFAGHGVQSNNQNYLIPIDADIKSDSEVKLFGINVDEFVATLERASGRVNIVILDSCRNNPFISASRGGKNGIGAIDAPTGTFIAFSTTPGQVALDGDGENSPYAAALAKAIETPGLSIEQTFKVARRQVLKETKDVQLPWDTSSLTGDFSFTDAPPAPPAVETPIVAAPEPKAEEPKIDEPPPEPEVALDTPQQGPSVVEEQPETNPIAQAPENIQEITVTPRIIPVGKWPEGITLAPDGLWVAESGIRQMSRINLKSNKIDKTVKTGRLPVQLATDDSGNVFANVVTDYKIFRQSRDGKGKAIASFPKLTYTADMVSEGGLVYALTQFDNPDRKFTVNLIDGKTGQLSKLPEVVGDPRALSVVGGQPWVLYMNGQTSELVYFDKATGAMSPPLQLPHFGWKMAANQNNLYIAGQVQQQVGEAMVTMISGNEQKTQSLKSEELIVNIAATDSHVIAMSYAGNGWILDANTLQPLKRFSTGVPAQTIIISGSSLYLSTHNGKGGNGSVHIYENILN